MTEEDRNAFANDRIIILKELDNGEAIGLDYKLFTVALVLFHAHYAEQVEQLSNGYKRRFCYRNDHEALIAGLKWNGIDDPSGCWVKEKSPGVDRFNPLFGTPLFDEA